MIILNFNLIVILIIFILIKLGLNDEFKSEYLQLINDYSTNSNNNNKLTSSSSSSNLPFQKFLKPIIDARQNSIENSVFKPKKIDQISEIFRESIETIKSKNKRNDVIFLIDSSSSIGKQNFISEIKFVKKLLSDFNISFNYTRVALITFSSQTRITRHIDQISAPAEDHDKCSLLNNEIPKIKFVGGGTYTYGALREAELIFEKSRKNSKKYIFLVTDGFSNGKDPIPIAVSLQNKNITIFTIGIQSGNYAELFNMSSSPKKNFNFLLDSFVEFEGLARRALRADYKIGESIKLKNQTRCNILCKHNEYFLNETNTCCDQEADCTCGTSSGHYTCLCHPGYYGSGKRNECFACPNGTYWHSSQMCRPCPDINHITIDEPALDINGCVCKSGWRKTLNHKCEGITCPRLLPPENGYMVEQSFSCTNVLNSACGIRCKSGYQLLGTSLRMCQEDGTWSGNETSCQLKLCPKLVIPYYGLIVCRNEDLDLLYDYSPKNSTFMKTYEDASKRITEPMPIDTECSYKCGHGFYLIGSRVRICLPLSKWDGLQTTCKQVLCPPLPKPNYGEYELSDCTEMKVPFGTNCTLLCPKGFTLQGPQTKSCVGKKVGVWTNKNKMATCVDVTPPEIVCPENLNFTVTDKNFITIKNLPPPVNLSDSSEMSVSFWMQPIVNESTGIELKIGEHLFTYTATDMFDNKAKCTFKVTVLDKTPPSVENCVDPDVFYTPVYLEDHLRLSKNIIEWDEPTFYDNSNSEIQIFKSLHPGHLEIGQHQAIYTATDIFNNTNQCILNITIREQTCKTLASPLNGKSLCAKNTTHTWCEITCNNGFAIFDEAENTVLDNFHIFCINQSPEWKYDKIYDCTPIEIPNTIEQVLTFPLDSEEDFCTNTKSREKFQYNLIDRIRNHLCLNQDDCDIISEIPECSEDANNGINEIANKSFYNIVKREIHSQNNNISSQQMKRKTRATVRIKILTKIGKRLGIWKKNQTLSENARLVKNELQTLKQNPELQMILSEMQVDLKKLKIEEFIRCPDGSISRKHLCVQCARGTYQDVAYNRCQVCPIATYNDRLGQISCTPCPLYYSTKRVGRQSLDECKHTCPPGTIAKIKNVYKKSLNSKSLMPSCQKCNPGEYQPYYDQIACLPCPHGYTSARGAQSLSECYKQINQPCQNNPAICGSFGYCIPNPNSTNSFTCGCQTGYYGARCEFQLNPCLFTPCYNNGHCFHINHTSVICHCPPQFTGRYCEELRNSCGNRFCRNGGTCIEVGDEVICECPLGYEGEFCEKEVNHCSQSPCERGNCINTVNGYQCQCPPGIIGKRCHLHPCDYLPCHKNAICINAPDFPAHKNSYYCKCPKGLKGYDCNQIQNPCESEPCKNNGYCEPLLLRNVPRNSSTINDENLDENIYEMYTCKCPPYFYGDNCETFTTPDFVMEFSKSSVTSFVELKGPSRSLSEISFCFWIKTSDSFNYGSILSYATESIDNMFTFTDYNGFILYVHGNYTVTDMVVNDGEWHFICASWMSENGFYEIYLDGILQHTGVNLSSGLIIKKEGTFIIGQEQDQQGGSFSETESFVGSIAYFDIWDSFLNGVQVQEFYQTCEPYQGSLYSWTDFKIKIHGDVQIHSSDFCNPCPADLRLPNGRVFILNNQAFYECNIGYVLEGNPIRICLKTSQWTVGDSYCKIVDCDIPEGVENGFIEYSSTIYNGEARYYCNNGFDLKGPWIRKCDQYGNWTGKTPECTSTVRCKKFNEFSHVTTYYGNSRGMLNTSLQDFSVGSFVEIFCSRNNETLEFIFTCMENGQWDGMLPDVCLKPIEEIFTIKNDRTTETILLETDSDTTKTREIQQIMISSSPKIVTTTQEGENETISNTNFWITTQTSKAVEISQATESSSEESNRYENKDIVTENLINPTESYFEISSTKASSFPVNYIPEKTFWINLKNFLFAGCSHKILKVSLLCKYQNASYSNRTLSDLSNFEFPHISQFQHVDIKLLELLMKHEHLFIQEIKVPFEIFFDLILYGNTNPSTSELLSQIMENSLRFILCIYIDAIIWDENSSYQQEPINKNIDEKLKRIISKIIYPVYIDFSERILHENSHSTMHSSEENFFITTQQEDDDIKEILEKNNQCSLNSIPEAFINSFVSGIQYPNGEFYDLPKMMKKNENVQMVQPETKIIYNCSQNYESQGEIISECMKDGFWSPINRFCKLKWCDDPPKINHMFYSKRQDNEKFEIGKKIQLNCYDGYKMHGNSEIVCLKTGKWTRVLGRCSRITCNRPKLPNGVTIIKGRSYLFEDKLQIKCPNEQIFEIICQKNGIWDQTINCN